MISPGLAGLVGSSGGAECVLPFDLFFSLCLWCWFVLECVCISTSRSRLSGAVLCTVAKAGAAAVIRQWVQQVVRRGIGAVTVYFGWEGGVVAGLEGVGIGLSMLGVDVCWAF